MRLLCSCLLALSLPALASTQLTLPDGREVVLEDDFTWHYLLTMPAQDGSPAPQLSQQALAEPALLGQSSAQGVTVTLVGRIQEPGRQRLKLQVHNLQAGSVVQVEGRVRFYSAKGVQLGEAPLRLWQSTYRLPETYLRQGDEKSYTTDWLSLPAGEANPLLQLQVLEVNRRS